MYPAIFLIVTDNIMNEKEVIFLKNYYEFDSLGKFY